MAMGNSKPSFDSPSDLLGSFTDYIHQCKLEKLVPSKAGFRAYALIPKSTYNDYRKLPEYSDTFNLIDDLLEDNIINNKNADPSLRSLVLKAKHNYIEQSKVVAETINHDITYDLSDSNVIEKLNSLQDRIKQLKDNQE